MDIAKLVDAAVRAGYGPAFVIILVCLAILAWQSPKLIAALSKCALEHRKLTHAQKVAIQKLENSVQKAPKLPKSGRGK